MLGIGAIIGTGIFVVTGVAANQNAGPALSLSFVLAAIVVILSGLSFAEFASRVPVIGGPYADSPGKISFVPFGLWKLIVFSPFLSYVNKKITLVHHEQG
ncbi:amino acid permease [Listeria innocua]